MEAEDQRGLAHFLEHMVFNGTKHYTALELVPRMQRLGIGFGAHVNAYTSFDETVYMLDLPDLSPDTMGLGFTVMRDFGDGALLQPDAIEKQRGVILAEKTSRDSVGYRLMQKQFDELLPDSLVTHRFPIGEEAVIQKARRERFVDLYSRYYVPSRMTFIVVGKIEPAAIKERIETTFGTMKNPGNAGPDPDMGVVKPTDGLRANVFTDKEVSATTVGLVTVRSFKRKQDTVATRLTYMPLTLAHAMIDRRFERIAKAAGSPIAGGSATRDEMFNHAEIGSLEVTAANDHWENAVPVLEQEFRRVLQHGFTESELAEAKANLLNAYEQAVKEAPTRKSEEIATTIAKSINDGEVLSTPQTNLEIARKGLESIKVEDCHAAFKAFWNAGGLHLILTTKEAAANTREQLAAAYEKSGATPVEAPAARPRAAFAYEHFGNAGTIVSRRESPDLGITHLLLSNGVRVNFKPTDFEKGRIHLTSRIGAGQLTQPKDKPGLQTLAEAIIDGGGLGQHSEDELRQILAGRNVGTKFSVGEDAFSLSGSTTPEDLDLELKLLCATLVDPGYREEAFRQFQKEVPMMYQTLKHTPSGPEADLQAWLHGGQPRFTMPSQDKMLSLTIDDVKNWVGPDLASGYLELSIVGDFAPDALTKSLLETVGSLPRRNSYKSHHDSARRITFPAAPAEKTFTFDSKIPQGLAEVIWHTDGMRGNLAEFRRYNLLAAILSDRLRTEIREKLGASYSPESGAEGSDALTNFGYIIALSTAKPDDAKHLTDVTCDLASSIAEKGASEDEFQRALKPVLSQLGKSLRDNNYWLQTVMSRCQEDPKRLAMARERDADYRSIRVDEINRLARKYFGNNNAIRVVIKPN